MSKGTKILSEICSFFSEKRQSQLLSTLSGLVESLNLDSRILGGNKHHNCKLSNLQIFHILVMLPFFGVLGFSHYGESALHKMFSGKKDLLYSFMSQDCIDWRHILYRIACKLIGGICIRTDYKQSDLPTVLIADDTDLPKTGFHIEAIGKVFSHVHQRSILGFKALMLCWSDGRSQFMLDFSLHGEKGKKEGKEQGLTAKQRQSRFSKERSKDSHAANRKEEYFVSKCDRLIQMVRTAIQRKIPFEYLLVDSWFTNTGLVDFVCRCHKKFHLLGMAKMGNTKYQSKWGELAAKSLITKLKTRKEVRYCRSLRCHYAITDVVLGKRKVRLIFCRQGKAQSWKLLLTTNTSLEFKNAYRIYAMRWTIEVFFSDGKRHLNLADCSCRNFTSQIAHISMVVVRYNLMAYIKRFHDYETIGALFKEIHLGVKELTVVECIWETIIEVIAVIAEMFSLDDEQLLSQIMSDNRRLQAMKALAQTA